MRFTVLGHAALWVEARGVRLLVDPWLHGSCYWRSWWHYPGSAATDEHLRPDLVAVTHSHFDHFHYPSMRRLAKGATVLVPRFGVDVMAVEMRRLGFDNVRELPHGRVVEPVAGLRLASYQYGFDDTALVVEADGVVLANLNDCKLRGATLRRLLADFGRPTFMLKSHSWAQAYPLRYRGEGTGGRAILDRASYVADFLDAARTLRPRYAVPFASMVCFLHPETRDVNDAVVTPEDVAAGVAAAGGVPGTDVVVMGPGDSWSSSEGFSRAPSANGTRAERIAALADAAAPSIVAAAAEEADRRLDWGAFAAYFGAFCRALPPGAGRLLLGRPVVFEVASDPGTPWWIVDGARRQVRRSASPPANRASVVRVPEAVLADAIDKGIVNLVHISMRIEVELAPGGLDVDFAFWGLLQMWELGYLPVRRMLTRRMAVTAWQRRRELVEVARAAFGRRGSFAERMAANLMTAEGGSRPGS